MQTLLCLVLLAIGVGPAGAQTPDYPSLFRVIQSAPESALASLQAEWRATFANTKGGRELVDALTEFRRFELSGDRRSAERAEKLAGDARGLAPDNAWMQYAYALVLAHGPEVRSNGPSLRVSGRSWAQQLGFDAPSKARRATEATLKLDSLHAGAAVLFAELALQRLESEPLQRARTTLLRVLTVSNDAQAALMLARVSTQLNDPERALAASAAALKARPDDPFALHAHALALFRDPGKTEEGAKQYFEAAARMTPAYAARLFEELQLIATPADTLRWRRASLEQRKILLSGFWHVRAGLGGVTVAERIAEHYRRLISALERYPRLTEGPASNKALVLESNKVPIDQRGELLVRHGEPWKINKSPGGTILTSDLAGACDKLAYDPMGEAHREKYKHPLDRFSRIVQPTKIPIPPAEVWAYRADDEVRLYPLMQCPGTADYVIPYELPCKVFDYSPDMMQQSFDVNRCGDETPERRRVIAREALRTDSHNPNVTQRIPYNYDLLSFRGSGGNTDLLAPVALLGDSITPTEAAGGRVRYSLALQLGVIDTARQTIVQSADTMAITLDRRLNPGDRLSLHAFISTPTTEYAFMRLVVRNLEHEQNGAFHTEAIRVPSYRGDTLMVSDVVLGSAVEGGNFRRGNQRISLMPFARFADGRFKVFYEVYNLPRGTQYRTQLLVESSSGRPQDGMRVEFADEAAPDADGVVRVLRTMETTLRPGRYRLTVRILLADKRFVEKTRQFIVGER